MERAASITARLGLAFWLVTGQGCVWTGGHRRGSQEPPTPQQAALIQQISERAQAAIDQHQYEQAKLELLQLVAISPRSAEAHHRLGKVLVLEGRLNEAEACFRKALELDGEYAGALIGLGTIEAAKGDYQAALKRFEMAIEIEPHDAEAHHALAGLQETLGQTDDALAAYFRTLELNPLHPQASRRIAAIQLARSQPDQALARLDQAIDQAPDDGESLLLRGQAHLTLNHLSHAIADLRAASSRLPGRADVYVQLAVALDAAHQKRDALQAAEHALRLAPNYADAQSLSERLRR